MARSKRILDRITTGRFTLPVVILLSIFYWFLTTYFMNLSSDSWIEQGGVLLFYSVIAYFLVLLNSKFAFIRKKSAMQIMIFSILISLFPSLHHFDVKMFFLPCSMSAFYFLFESYRHPYPMGSLFYVSLFLGAGSLLLPQAIWMLPLFLIGAYLFRALSLRSFCAVLLGLLFPYWLLFGYAYLRGEMELFLRPFVGMFLWDVSEPFSVARLFSLLYLFLLLSVGSVHCVLSGFEENQRTRNFLQFLILASFYVLFIVLLQPCLYVSLLPLLIVLISILSGHYFALTRTKSSDLFFLFFLLLTIFLMFFNIRSL
ncbi:MAG: hypothetical protein E7099_08340 [Mediterranea massiliensis]|nr:hypothetical protein [Mediterranea massiliensis]